MCIVTTDLDHPLAPRPITTEKIISTRPSTRGTTTTTTTTTAYPPIYRTRTGAFTGSRLVSPVPSHVDVAITGGGGGHRSSRRGSLATANGAMTTRSSRVMEEVDAVGLVHPAVVKEIRAKPAVVLYGGEGHKDRRRTRETYYY